jgi:hypothetical protein
MFVKECVVSCHFIFSWYYYAIQWVSMNETPVYNVVLMEVRVQLGTAHYVTVIQAATGHLYHHTHVGSLSNWVLSHKLIFCELFLLYRVII